MSNYRISAIKRLQADIISVISGTRKNNRYALADVCQMVLTVESFFPEKPRAIIRTMPVNLRKKVSATCSNCVKPAKMQELVSEAKTALRSYERRLQKWIDINDIEQTPPLKLADLTPTLKIK